MRRWSPLDCTASLLAFWFWLRAWLRFGLSCWMCLKELMCSCCVFAPECSAGGRRRRQLGRLWPRLIQRSIVALVLVAKAVVSERLSNDNAGHAKGLVHTIAGDLQGWVASSAVAVMMCPRRIASRLVHPKWGRISPARLARSMGSGDDMFRIWSGPEGSSHKEPLPGTRSH